MNSHDIWQLLLGKKEGPGRQVKVWWLVGLAALGAMLMILSGTGATANKNNQPAITPATAPVTVSQDSGTKEMEDKLKSVLSQVAGAGRVEVEIHLADTGQTDYATNVNTDKKASSQKDSGGTSNVTTDNSENDQVVMNQSGGSDTGAPVVRRKTAPQVDGVLIIADGATNPAVREALSEAAAVALHVAPYQVLVLPRGGA
ncbi:MAG TPA: hypothetical protein VMW83_03315 [Spirochaetia bacterium]|nr:hypothetical protein [Spirochaetia bacterium]